MAQKKWHNIRLRSEAFYLLQEMKRRYRLKTLSLVIEHAMRVCEHARQRTYVQQFDYSGQTNPERLTTAVDWREHAHTGRT